MNNNPTHDKRITDAEKMLESIYFSSVKKDPDKGLKTPRLEKEEGKKAPPPAASVKATAKKDFNKSKNGILSLLNLNSIKKDRDRLLILAVFMLLMGEGEDELLTLALIYVML